MRVAALLALVLLLSGCDGGSDGTSGAEDVVRAWSEALNADDDEAAADLFAPGARVTQGGVTLRLRTHEDAVQWNEALPCDGKIVDLETKNDTVTATFLLADSATTPCDGPGQEATALFTIKDGKITAWQQAGGAPAPGGDVV